MSSTQKMIDKSMNLLLKKIARSILFQQPCKLHRPQLGYISMPVFFLIAALSISLLPMRLLKTGRDLESMILSKPRNN